MPSTSMNNNLNNSFTDCSFFYSEIPTELESAESLEGNLSPRKQNLKRKLEKSEIQNSKYRKKIRLLQQQNRRNNKKIKNLNMLFKSLKTKKLMTEEDLDVLHKSAEPNKEFLTRQLAKAKRNALPKTYSPELRTFALTLHYYSPRAYDYVRKTFNSSLPHRRTISKWYQHVNGEPGFTTEAFSAISNLMKCTTHSLLFSLTMDEMAIRRHIEFDGKKFHGYVDTGAKIDDDSLPVAKEAIVFMVVGVNCRWKIPIGYFLVDGVSASQRANLTKQCLTLLNSVKAKVISFTFDGLPANLCMARQLGCVLEPTKKNPILIRPLNIQ